VQIPRGHGACGLEAAEGSRVESDVLDMVANPVRFVRREEIAVKVRSLMRGVARRELDNKLYRTSNVTNLLNQEKRKRSHSGDTDFSSYWHLRYDTSEVLLY
jgi:hypothetical protein